MTAAGAGPGAQGGGQLELARTPLVLLPGAAERLATAYRAPSPSPQGAHLQPPSILRAGVLPSPHHLAAAPKGPAPHPPRDLHTEAGATAETLRLLALPAGSLVRLSAHPARGGGCARLARIRLLDTSLCPGSAYDGAVLLSPALAQNLGLRPWLAPLLADGSGSGSGGSDGPPGIGAEMLEVSAVTCSGEGGSGDHAETTATVPQPMGGSAGVPVATTIALSQVRCVDPRAVRLPSSAADAAAKEGQGGADERSPSRGSELVEGLQAHFQSAGRFVGPGDVVTAAVPRRDGRAELLEAIYGHAGSSAGARAPAVDVVCFRITHMEPQRCALVDTERTAITLAGSCTSAIPVGVHSFASPANGLDCSAPRPDAAEAILGAHPCAAWADSPSFAAAGPLLPPWRIIGRLLAAPAHPAALGAVRVAILLSGPAGSGRKTAARAAAAAAGMQVAELSCRDLHASASRDSGVAAGIAEAFKAAASFAPAILLLTHLQALTASASAVHQTPAGAVLRVASALSSAINNRCSSPVVLVAVTASADDVPAPVRRCFTHEVEVEAPDADDRRDLLSRLLARTPADTQAAVPRLAQQSVGLLARDLVGLCADAGSFAAAEEAPGKRGALCTPLAERHLDASLSLLRKRTATDVGAPSLTSGTKWDDVGGLEHCKRAIMDTVDLPLKHRDLFSGGLRQRSGVLLYGPPGTGKTLLAKAVANECSVNFLSVKGPELINMYIGESERQIREVFARARRAAPCVVFFDEMDALAPARGAGADSGGVMDRVVSQLLAEVDGVQASGEGSSDVFIIAATNRPDLIDPALLRPGRLDTLLYVGIAATVDARMKVLQALTRKFSLAKDVDLAAVAKAIPHRFTGADMYALCSDAWTSAMKRQVLATSTSHGGPNRVVVGAADMAIQVELCDFHKALQGLQPSLSEAELKRYEALRLQYEKA